MSSFARPLTWALGLGLLSACDGQVTSSSEDAGMVRVPCEVSLEISPPSASVAPRGVVILAGAVYFVARVVMIVRNRRP